MTRPPRTFRLSPDLTLPADAVTQALAFLARRGAGKTYAAQKLAEEMVRAGAQIVVFDPVGNWYGLRLGADGKSPGLSIPVLGGAHGDLRLDATAGGLVAKVVVERGASVVLDVSEFRKNERKRFATDFAEEFFHLKKSARSAVHVFIEEAQVFVPQRVSRGEERMLGAFEDMVKLGRNYGIGVTLISQRPQAVNKDALNQAEALFALQTTGAQERTALKAWMTERHVDLALLDELPSLPIGTAFVWSPSWLRVFKQIRISKKTTYDASATPTFGGRGLEPRTLSPVDLEELRAALEQAWPETDEKPAGADLRAQISRLERRNAELVAELERVRRVPKVVVDLSALARLEKALSAAGELVATLTEVPRELGVALASARSLAAAGDGTPPATPPRSSAGTQGAARSRSRPQSQNGEGASAPGFRRGARQMLAVLAGMGPLTRMQLGTLAGLVATSGTFAQYLGELRRANLVISTEDGRLAATEAGRALIGDGALSVPSTTGALVELWSARFRAGARAMLAHLVAAYPSGFERGTLAASVGMAPSSGTFSQYLGELVRNGLVEKRGHLLVASSSLFLFSSGGAGKSVGLGARRDEADRGTK